VAGFSPPRVDEALVPLCTYRLWTKTTFGFRKPDLPQIGLFYFLDILPAIL
jgi:hypothetical protein